MRTQSRQGSPDHHLPRHPNLTPGPTTVSSIPLPQISAPPIMNNSVMHMGFHSPPQSFGLSQLAQYQF